MKKYLSVLLVASFFGIAIYGFAIFDMGSSHTGGCIASSLDGTACPTNIIAFATHHISAIQTLTTVLPSSSSLLLLLASLLLISFSIFLFYKNSLYPKLKLLRERLRDLEFNFSYIQQKITSWLSLFELSPAL